jgi:copper chaperone NosL
MNNGNRLKTSSVIILIVAGLLLATNIFLPIWKIELYAPQYPEGLELKIYADELGGNVEIINGLNHYIGMKTLHTEDFVEFSILTYIIGFFAACFIIVALLRRKMPVYILFGAFLLFGILAMADFYRWNYDYGHDLDPHAAIKVPGMAYQPPLIGYKQLLNFGAYSIPDTGGILFIASGLMLLLVVLIERNVFSKLFRRKAKTAAVMITLGMLSLNACTQPGPKPIQLNVDSCANCKMTITVPHFATQLSTQKGRQYLFDDISCMAEFKKTNPDIEYKQFYVADFTSAADFIDIDHVLLLHSDSLRSPMGGNIAGFAVRDSLVTYQARFGGQEIKWNNLIQ